MLILGHTIPELRKTVVQVIFAAAALLAFFIHFNPGITAATAAVAIALFGVVAVFNARHIVYSDVTKALMALVTAGIALVAFFHHFNTGETDRIIAIAGAALNVGAVIFVRNAGARLPKHPPTRG